MKQQHLDLNQPWEAEDIAGKMYPALTLYYTPEKPEVGIEISCLPPKGLYVALKLTQQETLTLVRALRQIPAIEQATAPECVSDIPPETVAQST